MFGKAEGGFKDAVVKKHGSLQKIKGAVGEHSYSEEEKVCADFLCLQYPQQAAATPSFDGSS